MKCTKKNWPSKQTAVKPVLNSLKLWAIFGMTKSIELVLFRNQLIDRNVKWNPEPSRICRRVCTKAHFHFDSVEIAQAIKTLISPAKLDIGKLTYEYHLEDNRYQDAIAFVSDKLKGAKNKTIVPKDVVLYGFGRIGRLLARELMTRTGKGNQMRLRAVVTRGTVDQNVLEKKGVIVAVRFGTWGFSGNRKCGCRKPSFDHQRYNRTHDFCQQPGRDWLHTLWHWGCFGHW